MDSSEVISETRKMIDEILELEDALERLAGAHIVVEGLNAKIAALNETIDLQKSALDWKREQIEALREIMYSTARNLSNGGRIGGKTKDRAIFQAIAIMLNTHLNYAENPDNSDVPF